MSQWLFGGGALVYRAKVTICWVLRVGEMGFVPEDVGVFGNISGPLRGISNVTGRRRCREEYRLAFGLAAVAFSSM